MEKRKANKNIETPGREEKIIWGRKEKDSLY